uniref:Uncharacterized protein n=1 Tax=Anguilla anguilla TaxID=7936 RepID=A0A0E9UJF1_ANGAN
MFLHFQKSLKNLDGKRYFCQQSSQ